MIILIAILIVGAFILFNVIKFKKLNRDNDWYCSPDCVEDDDPLLRFVASEALRSGKMVMMDVKEDGAVTVTYPDKTCTGQIDDSGNVQLDNKE